MNDPSAPKPPDQEKKIPGLPPLEEEALGMSDDRAQKEAEQLSSGRSAEQLKRESAEHEHDRNEGFRDLFDTLIKVGVVLGFVVVVLFGFTWAWHLLTPMSWHYLSEEGVDHIQNIVTGGVIASLVADHFKRRLE